MITPLLTLLFVVTLFGLLWRVIRRPRAAEFEGPLDPFSAVAALSRPETYRPVARLFTTEDAAFVAGRMGREGRLQDHLRRARCRVMRLYLVQIRSDFEILWRLARSIAPYSTNPNFATVVTWQYFSFYFLLTVVRLRGFFGWRLLMPVQVSGLVSAMEQLRTGILRTLADLEPAPRRAVPTRG